MDQGDHSWLMVETSDAAAADDAGEETTRRHTPSNPPLSSPHHPPIGRQVSQNWEDLGIDALAGLTDPTTGDLRPPVLVGTIAEGGGGGGGGGGGPGGGGLLPSLVSPDRARFLASHMPPLCQT